MCIKTKNKYKVYSKITFSFLNYFPNRLKTFKRSKWKKVNSLILKQSKIKQNKLSDQILIKKTTKRWDKLSLYYKQGHTLKKAILKLFGNSLNIKFFKNQLKNKEFSFFKLLVKPLFRLDILLWKLNFYPTVRKAQQKIKSKKILLNNNPINGTCLLKKGDIIQVLDRDLIIKKNFLKNFFLFHFCEIDPYSNTFVILKDYNSFTSSELSVIFPEYVNLKQFIYYLSKK